MADRVPDLPEWLRVLAERRGLARVLALVPASARPALERAGEPLPPPPDGTVTEPAAGFVADADRDGA